jgi:pilus assembly protein TadC
MTTEPLLIAALYALCLLSAWRVLHLVWKPQSDIVVVAAHEHAEEEPRGLVDRLLRDVLEAMSTRGIGSGGREPLARLIVHAGMDDRMTVTDVYVRGMTFASLGVLGVLGVYLLLPGFPFILVPTLGAVIAYLGMRMPISRLRSLRTQRQWNALTESVIWLTKISVLSLGRTLGDVFLVLGNSRGGVLERESECVALAISFNTPIDQALQEMADRIDVQEVTAAIDHVIKSYRSGIEMSQALIQRASLIQGIVQRRVEERVSGNVLRTYAITVVFALPLLFFGLLAPMGYNMLRSLPH